MGGVYNSMTADLLARLRHLGRIEHDRQRQLPKPAEHQGRVTPPDTPQWFRVPSDTYFNPGALDNLRLLGASRPMIVTDGPTVARGVAEEVRHYSHRWRRARVLRRSSRSRPRRRSAPGCEELGTSSTPTRSSRVGGGSVMDAAKAMRLFHESPQLSIRELSLPFLDARKRIASISRRSSTRSGWSRSRRRPARARRSPRPPSISVGNRKVTLVDYSLVPDMAIVDPTLTLTMPQEITADTGIDALTHALEAAVSIFASPYTDAFCVQAVNLILDVAATRLPGRLGPRRRARRWPTPRRSPGSRSRTRSSASTMRWPTPSAPASASPTAAPTRSSCPTSCATTRRCRASSCRRPATPPTSRPRSTRRSPGSSARRQHRAGSARAAVRPCAMSCWPRSTSRARWPTAA